jgi:Uma2 family endonuclease
VVSVPRQHVFSYEEYARIAATSEMRLEFWQGVILDMSGGSPRHSAICANIAGILRTQLRGGPCRVFDANLRLRSIPAQRTTYADVSVVCGPLLMDPADPAQQTVLNPTLIIEVESPSTASDDRGPKLDCYKLMSSVQAVLLVAQDRQEVGLHQRLADGSWRQSTQSSGAVQLDAVRCTLPIDEVYEQLPEA